jgi:hypothetical protein
LRLEGLRVLLHAHSFALGLAFGGVAMFVASVVAASTRRRVPDVAGLAFVAAAWLGIRGAWGIELARSSVAWALVLLAFGGAIVAFVTARSAPAKQHVLLITALALAPGAVMLAMVTPLAGSSTSRVALGIATVAVGVGLRDYDAINGPKGAPWLLFAVSAAGVYLAVPDTELARVLLGVALPFVLLSVPKPVCPFGPAGSAALAGVFVWVVFVGGRGRPGSVVGGLATVGFLLAEPIGRRVIGRDRRPRLRRRTLLDPRFDQNQDSWLSRAAIAGLAQFAVAVYASRVVGRYDAALPALLVLMPMVVAVLFAAPEVYPLTGERPKQAERTSRSSSHSHSHGRHRHRHRHSPSGAG